MYIKIAHSNGFSLVTMVGNKWAEVSKHEHEMHIERSSIIIYGHTNKSIKKKIYCDTVNFTRAGTKTLMTQCYVIW